MRRCQSWSQPNPASATDQASSGHSRVRCNRPLPRERRSETSPSPAAGLEMTRRHGTRGTPSGRARARGTQVKWEHVAAKSLARRGCWQAACCRAREERQHANSTSAAATRRTLGGGPRWVRRPLGWPVLLATIQRRYLTATGAPARPLVVRRHDKLAGRHANRAWAANALTIAAHREDRCVKERKLAC